MKAFALIPLLAMFLIPVLLGTGCSREGVFENPDSIEVTTFNAIQGKPGHLVTFTIGEDTTGLTKRAVLALQDREVSPYPLYIVFESGNAGLHGLIDLLNNATDVAVVADLPENREPLTRLWLNSGEGERYAGFLRITASTGTQYLSIRGTLSQERKEWFLTELAKTPVAVYTTPIIAVDEIPPDDLTFYIHGDGTSDKPTEYKGIVQDQRDFSGYVLVPKVNREVYPIRMGAVRPFSQTISGVTVTIMSGERSGENTITDQNGQYIFKNVQEDELHLLVEKEYFESKEVIVHRSRQTILASGDVPNYGEDPQKTPGNILIGQALPDPVRPILQQVPMVYDLLYIEVDLLGKHGGLYDSGVIAVDSNQILEWHGVGGAFGNFAHEIAHMRQHAIVSVDGSGDLHNWVNTPEGKSFAEARQKDLSEIGKSEIDRIPAFSSLVENSAEICAYYWTGESRPHYRNLRATAPNRYTWAQEWLKKKYAR